MAVIEAISTTYLEADAASVMFSSLGSYEHLQLRCSARSDRTGVGYDRLRVRFNSDSGSNYSNHWMWGENTTGSANRQATNPDIEVYYIDDTKNNAAVFGGVVLDILDYRNGSKNTTVQYVAGFKDENEIASFGSGLWDNVAAVTAIELAADAGSNLMRGSEFTLYGLNSS